MVEYGGFWIRVAASLLDGVILGLPTTIIGYGLLFATGSFALYNLVLLAYVVLIVYLDGTKGGTPGKLILKLRIVNEQGQFIGIPMAILRYIGKIVATLLLGIGLLMIAFTEKKQGLHDKIAKTYVIKV